MLFDLIAAVAAGFCVAGLALSLRWLSRGRLPRWIVPAAAGLGMLGYALWSEYSWLERAQSSLPDGVVLVSSNQVSAWYRPWSLLWPQADRLIALDRRAERRNAALPGHVLGSVLLMGRWQPTRQIAVMFDCEGGRRADLLDGVRLDDKGLPLGARWVNLDPDDGLLRAACAAGAGRSREARSSDD